MQKESDLMSHPVFAATAFWVFVSAGSVFSLVRLFVKKTGPWPQDQRVKGEVSSWKCGARDRKRGQMPDARDSGSWEIKVTALRNFHLNKGVVFCFFCVFKITWFCSVRNIKTAMNDKGTVVIYPE